MFKKFFLFVSGLPIYCIVHGQHKTITIIDSETYLPLHSVTVGFDNTKDYKFTDKNGNAIIETKRLQECDSIFFSFVGYKIAKVKRDDLPDTVLMVLETTQLENVIIKKIAFKKKSVVLGSREFNLRDEVWLRPGGIIGIYIKNIDSMQGLINKVIFRFNSIPNNTEIRVRLKAINSDQTIGVDIIDSSILFRPFKKETEINLKDYHILFPENGIFLACEFIGIGEEFDKYSAPLLKVRMSSNLPEALTWIGTEELLSHFKFVNIGRKCPENAQFQLEVFPHK